MTMGWGIMGIGGWEWGIRGYICHLENIYLC